MEKRDKLLDIRLIRPDGRGTSILAVETVKECYQSLFKCDGVHVCSCVSHVSPTFSYRPERDKSRTPVKNGSDNIVIFPLYGISLLRVYGQKRRGGFREARLSVPLRGARCAILCAKQTTRERTRR